MLDERVKQYFENPRSIKSVDTDDDFNLLITFDNHELRRYRMKERLTGVFSVLCDKKKFKTVFLDEFGNAAWDIDESIDSSIHWNNRIDICKDALYLDSEPIN